MMRAGHFSLASFQVTSQSTHAVSSKAIQLSSRPVFRENEEISTTFGLHDTKLRTLSLYRWCLVLFQKAQTIERNKSEI